MTIKNRISLLTLLAALATAIVFTGCGGDSPSAGGTNGNTNITQNTLAPDGIGGKTFNGRIGTTTTTWQIVFSGGGTSGTYSYSENGQHLDSGNFTYTKT